MTPQNAPLSAKEWLVMGAFARVLPEVGKAGLSTIELARRTGLDTAGAEIAVGRLSQRGWLISTGGPVQWGPEAACFMIGDGLDSARWLAAAWGL